MKKKILLALAMVLAGLFTVQKAQAQVFDTDGNVHWKGSTIAEALDAGSIYLYSPDLKQYLNVGGNYGVQGKFNTGGWRFTFQRANDGTANCYNFRAPVTNPEGGLGNYLSTNRQYMDGADPRVYTDRGGTDPGPYDAWSHPNWRLIPYEFTETFDQVTEDGTESVNLETNTFILQNNNTDRGTYYITTDANGCIYVTTNRDIATKFRLIRVKDFETAMNNISINGQVDLTPFIQDPDFQRLHNDGALWEWRDFGASPEYTGNLIDESISPTGVHATPDKYLVNNNNNWQNIENLPFDNNHKPDSRYLNGWYQRNQNWMCGGMYVNADNPNNVRDQAILWRGSYCGRNLEWTAGTPNPCTFRQMWEQQSTHYVAEIYNKPNIELSQELSLPGVTNKLATGLYRMTFKALYYNGQNTNLASDGNANAVFFFRIGDGAGAIYREVPIPVLTVDAKSVMDGSSGSPKSGLAAGKILEDNPDDYTVNVFMYAPQDAQVRIGIRVKDGGTNEAPAWTVFDDVHITGLGLAPLLLNENWEDKDEQVEYYVNRNPRKLPGRPYFWLTYPPSLTPLDDEPDGLKERASNVYYTRTMTTGEWNSICLPFALTASQLKDAFGATTMLSEFKNLSGANGTTIMFEKAGNGAWDTDPDWKMTIGQPYLIKPSADPQRQEEGKIQWDYATIDSGNYVEIPAKTYVIPNVSYGQLYDRTGQSSQTPEAGEDESETTEGLKYHGNFYKTVIPASDIYNSETNPNGNQNYYVISKGKMYHLTGTKNQTIYATYAYLTLPKESSAGKASLSIDGIDDNTTVIEGVIGEDGTVTSGNVYTVNGQKVAANGQTDGLSKGVYIVNGKKLVVR